MQRTVALTTPWMRGLDIQHLELAMDKRSVARGGAPIKVDGVWSAEDEHALATIAYELGLDAFDGSPAVTRLIEHPEFRTPAELARAHSRAKVAAEHPKGLAQIPIIAAKFIGVHEIPAGSNRGAQVDAWSKHFGMEGAPWCGIFDGNMIELAGGNVTPRVAYVPSIAADAQAGVNGFERWTTDHTQITPGWSVCFRFGGPGTEMDHVEIVESVHPDHLTTIGGNTGGSDPADGGMVARNQRTYTFVAGYAKPRILA